MKSALFKTLETFSFQLPKVLKKNFHGKLLFYTLDQSNK